jgi:hypothetical protein
MSGGRFDYDQYKIGYIAEAIEGEIEKNGREKTREELKEESWRSSDWYEKYPEDKFHYKYSDNVIEEFKNAVKYLKIAEIYAQRVDWLLSADDSEESFIRRLKEELDKLKV